MSLIRAKSLAMKCSSGVFCALRKVNAPGRDCILPQRGSVVEPDWELQNQLPLLLTVCL